MDEDEFPIYIGVNLPAKHGLSNQTIVDDAITQGYDLVTARVTSRQYRKRIQELYELHDIEAASSSYKHSSVRTSTTTNSTPQLLTTPSAMPIVPAPLGDDVNVLPGTHIANTIALAAPWVELDSKDDRFAELSLRVLEHEFAYAQFCGLPYIVLEGPRRRTHVARYAHALDKLMRANRKLNVMVHTTFTEEYRNGQPPSDMLSTWEVWDALRTTSDHRPQLYLALEVQSADLPNYLLSRWFCEPVAMLILSAPQLYVPNAKQYPVLPKHLQQLVLQYAVRRPYFLLKDTSVCALDFAGGETAPLLYLRHLCSGLNADHFAAAEVADVLQPPLQPLVTPLESTIYEVFEADEEKYTLYDKAIRAALDTELIGCSRVIACVAGAGRGALVDRVLSACADANKPVFIYAVERNPSAAAYLTARQLDDSGWINRVEIVTDDVRRWQPPHRVNLLVAELLGSFGDNELSPECLDGAQRMLDPSQSVVIPASYTAFAAPVFAPSLWANARSKRTESPSRGLHQPYVVRLHQADRVADPVPLWQFTHPTSLPGQTQRSAKVSYHVQYRSRVYGFAGYFEAELHAGIELSTNPLTQAEKSPALSSWFPLWFPLATPLDVQPGSDIDFSIWRETAPGKVWYEWTAESFSRDGPRRTRIASTVLHNAGGEAYTINAG